MNKLLIFDLDDTLYPEQSYVLSGYQAVAKALSSRSHVSETDLFEFLKGYFQTAGRQGAFDALLQEFAISNVEINSLVRLYRRHTPTIVLEPHVRELLASLRQRFPLALITNGWVSTQKRKVAALGLESSFDLILFAQNRGLRFRKPHPRSFRKAMSHFNVQAHEAIVVGDDESSDGDGARSLGIPYFRVAKPGDLTGLQAMIESVGPLRQKD
jgi:putative hydrolase of the HAD superfamily